MNGLLSKNKNPTMAEHVKFGEVDKVARTNTRFFLMRHKDKQTCNTAVTICTSHSGYCPIFV
jgi:hypothetical protein